MGLCSVCKPHLEREILVKLSASCRLLLLAAEASMVRRCNLQLCDY